MRALLAASLLLAPAAAFAPNPGPSFFLPNPNPDPGPGPNPNPNPRLDPNSRPPTALRAIPDLTTSTVGFGVAATGLAIGAGAIWAQVSFGDKGLANFINLEKDENPFYSKRFRPDEKPEDPLPWLKLPKFDYVEVYGQEEEPEVEGEEVEGDAEA
mmetsp:Transcript_726/g.1809  ORF Transcript_726/g.1809 Transcript_726/m.1809 type:complete len:156 (-) Transcript_726:80-547(-)